MKDLTPEKSKIVQETLFKNGYKWNNTSTQVICTNSKQLYLEDNELTHEIDNLPYFNNYIELPELTFEEFERMYVNKNIKFKVGDWVIRKDLKVCKIVNIHNSGNRFEDQDKIHNNVSDIVRLATEEEVIEITGEFVLPEQWYVTVTKENKHILSKWRWPHLSDILEEGYIVGISNRFSKQGKEHNGKYEKYFGEEITFEQFKKYVLKEPSKEDLLAEARKLYPIGTKVCRESGNVVEISSIPEWHDHWNFAGIKEGIEVRFARNAFGYSGGLIWDDKDKKWAEIVQDTLKVSDLVEGEIYYTRGWIHDKVDSNDYKCNNTALHAKTLNFYNKCAAILDINNHPSRIATQEEKDWLNYCIKKGKFVDKETALKSKEMKFEVGKWDSLKADHIDINDKWFLKLKKESNISYIGEYCNRKYVEKGSFAKTLNYSLVELTDLSEIQQYLPDGHVDKVKDSFILPKYWYCELNDSSKDILNYWRKHIIKYSDTDCPGKYICEEGALLEGWWREVEITFQQFLSHVWNGKEYYDSIRTNVSETVNKDWSGFHFPKNHLDALIYGTSDKDLKSSKSNGFKLLVPLERKPKPLGIKGKVEIKINKIKQLKIK